MKIGVAGAGAVGGYFGAKLANAGHSVVFLARGRHYEKMHEKGLQIKSETENFHVDGTFTDQYEDFEGVDLVLFSVKSIDTQETARKLLPYLKEDTLILTLQNGVDNEETLSEIFGKERILSAATYIQSSIKEPGVVEHIGMIPRLVIGSLESNGLNHAEKVATLFQNAGIETYQSSNIMNQKWKKLLWNVTFNPLSAVAGTQVGEILDDAGLRVTAESICKEAISVANRMENDFDVNFYETIMEQGKIARNHKTSMLQDKLSGKQMEYESICGYIVKKGQELDVSTPVLETIYSLLKFSDSAKLEKNQKVN
ncbi:ketopantoate reductase family protein [Bacillus sp. V5-8f]|uniref:ketopantoate reductase family protein n=1 Tax=Bacillus sp. V5-8f TaxID=2053044 RepID=UPI0015E05F36|nr:2-dehydropantoate 2-reductase [Bacillus sp. V5-8f]